MNKHQLVAIRIICARHFKMFAESFCLFYFATCRIINVLSFIDIISIVTSEILLDPQLDVSCFVDRCLFFCSFFFWPLFCPSFFDLRILITALSSSNSSILHNINYFSNNTKQTYKLQKEYINMTFNLVILFLVFTVFGLYYTLSVILWRSVLLLE